MLALIRLKRGGITLSIIQSILRWLAVPIGTAAIAAAGVTLSSWLVTLADNRCTSMVAGTCVESWHSDAVEWSTYLGIGLALFAIPLLSSWIAPALKTPTAILMSLLASGVLLSGYLLTSWNDLLPPALLGALAALAGIILVWRSQRKAASMEQRAT